MIKQLNFLSICGKVATVIHSGCSLSCITRIPTRSGKLMTHFPLHMQNEMENKCFLLAKNKQFITVPKQFMLDNIQMAMNLNQLVFAPRSDAVS